MLPSPLSGNAIEEDLDVETIKGIILGASVYEQRWAKG